MKLKGFFSKLLVAFIILANIAFAIRILSIFEKSGVEPTALVYAWFAFTTGELLTTGLIKIKKMKEENNGD